MTTFGKEIITVQFGSSANYVGSHFFNIQSAGFSFNPDFPSDVNHDILFREGQSENGSFSYTPRLVCVDFEKSLVALSKTGRNFDSPPTLDEVQSVTQTDNLEVVYKESVSKNEYFEDVEKQTKSQDSPNAMDVDLLLKTKYDLTNSLKSWSEVLTLSLHPRSITTIPSAVHGGLDLPKTTFKSGLDIWRNPLFADEFEDNLRFQLESCDTVQGFHLLTECDNLYSGVSSGCLDYVRDECAKKSILSIPILNFYADEENVLENRKRLCANIINAAHSFSHCNDLSDIVAPFSSLTDPWSADNGFRSFGVVNYDGSSAYQNTAIMGSCLDLITLPYRLKRRLDTTLSSIVALHGLPGRKFVGAGVVFPFPERKVDMDILEILRKNRYSSLCPHVDLENTLDTQSVTLRGFPPDQFPNSPALFVSKQNFRIPRTFPDIISAEHDLAKSALYHGRLRETSALAGLCNTREMRGLLNKLVENLRSLNIHKIPAFISTDLEKPEYDEMTETLSEASSCYDISMFL